MNQTDTGSVDSHEDSGVKKKYYANVSFAHITVAHLSLLQVSLVHGPVHVTFTHASFGHISFVQIPFAHVTHISLAVFEIKDLFCAPPGCIAFENHASGCVSMGSFLYN